ncbi:LexA family transcriptional regulator [Haemophilus paracuniculus]|uniref:LexA family transcriptional regulator n=1 Tax=Haemophilus paracuniculus TaxID=734 RepID=A0A1T0AMN7_9PAST|nr:LexA regulated protein [Haemophilus paracuniculus]OOR97177.1 LexA family transcriptional regulator [Haemophilus paracuniculus]
MAKQDADCITLDLFANTPKVGRPRTNPLSREQQIRINKRNQLKRDRSSGLKRVELKLHSDLVQCLEEQATQRGLTRGQLIEQILNDYIHRHDESAT